MRSITVCSRKCFFLLLVVLLSVTTVSQSASTRSNHVRKLTPLNNDPWEDITVDTFDDETWGTYTDGGRKARLDDVDFFDRVIGISSQYSARLQHNKGRRSSFYHTAYQVVDQYDDLRLTFFYYTKRMTSGIDEFLIEYMMPGTNSWTILETINQFSNEEVQHKTIYVDSSVLSQLSNGVKLRFRCNGENRKTRVYVDDIRFQGQTSGPESTPMPSVSPSGLRTATPTASPSKTPSAAPSATPSAKPTSLLSAAPTKSLATSIAPSASPSESPSSDSSLGPSQSPSASPSASPSGGPSDKASQHPSSFPSTSPPSHFPSSALSVSPSAGSRSSLSQPPTDVWGREEICPLDRLYPPSKLEILPFPDTIAGDGVEDDLGEISSLVFSDLTDVQGNLYGYAVSDKNQFSLKVLRFPTGANTATALSGSAVTAATYELKVNYSNSDWEDISLGPCDDSPTSKTCIYIGNIGNNDRGGGYARRHILSIFKFEEPAFDSVTRAPQTLTNHPVTTILYRYKSDLGWTQTESFYDAEAMFVDWAEGVGKGDIYIVTKGRCGKGVGLIPASHHQTLSLDNISPETADPILFDEGDIFPMARVIENPPTQGKDITCKQGAFRHWQGADMRRDGRLIALITGESPPRVYFYPREPGQTVLSALTSSTTTESASCDFIASTSYGLSNEKKHEAVAFTPDGTQFADTSECSGGGSCNVPIYFWDLVSPNSPEATNRDALIPTDGWVVISSDDFETGNHLGSYVNGSRAYASQSFSCPSATANTGWAIHIHEHKGVESSITHSLSHDASPYNWLRIDFDFLMDGFDHMDTLFLELSLDDGATFQIVSDWAKDVDGIDSLRVCYNITVALQAESFGQTTFGSTVQLRFRTSANAKNDRVYVDNIRFEGHVGLLI